MKYLLKWVERALVAGILTLVCLTLTTFLIVGLAVAVGPIMSLFGGK